ncbi:uncharacterized protein LOC121856796 [Homarus americanus]|uniref:SP-like 6 n=1 Tax=Homarus americanus TaxID=6706 RepID=A0A8J5MJZ5_HOMAM|nr:uncharacterized protein LOC121856796 [Homarus americanus]XP_042208436.1 uncharacterized protein LOC121856796 [Homarus americanus]XP_042208437.1 uncharacterized protein LOC121856796 [Homarus americanus]XP_042208438.1 uncharacterized protein LOC121856796 [Homarus americanus]KAG7154010.1 SP-like 6 [Homarus americanus]
MMTTPTTRPLPLPLLLLLFLLPLCRQASGIQCVQCKGETGGEGEDCIHVPPDPEPCDSGMTTCLTVRTYTPAEEDTRTLVSLVRTCSPTDLGWDCEKGKTKRGQIAEVCHDSCTWDGCNHAHTPTATTPSLLLFSVMGCLWVASLVL